MFDKAWSKQDFANIQAPLLKYSQSLHATETGISAGLMGHLAHMQALPPLPSCCLSLFQIECSFRMKMTWFSWEWMNRWRTFSFAQRLLPQRQKLYRVPDLSRFEINWNKDISFSLANISFLLLYLFLVSVSWPWFMLRTDDKRKCFPVRYTLSFFIRVYFIKISRMKFAIFYEYLKNKTLAEIVKRM